MVSKLPIYQQLLRRFYWLMLLCFIPSLLAAVLYYLQNKDISHIVTHVFPEQQTQQQWQQLLLENELLINNFTKTDQTIDFVAIHQALIGNLQRLAKLPTRHKGVISQTIEKQLLLTSDIEKLAQNSKKNAQTKERINIQIALVLDNLTALISQLSSKKNRIYATYVKAEFADKDDIKRIRYMIDLSEDINSHKALYRHLLDMQMLFTQLNLQYDPIEFSYLQKQSSVALEQWLSYTSDSNRRPKQAEQTFQQVGVLHSLLFAEQKTFTQWNEQLEAFSYLYALLLKQHTALTKLTPPKYTPLVINNIMHQFIGKTFSMINIDVAPTYYVWVVVSVFVLLLISILLIIKGILSRLILHHNSIVKLVTDTIEQGKDDATLLSDEMVRINDALKQMAPAINSDLNNNFDRKKLQKTYQTKLASLVKHSGHVFWHLPSIEPKERQAVAKFLQIKSNTDINHWRHLFSRTDVKLILNKGKKVKLNGKVEHISLLTLKGQAITLSIEYQDNQWLGSISSCEEIQQLTLKNEESKNQLIRFVDNEQQRILSDCIQMNKFAHSELINTQVAVIEAGQKPVTSSVVLKQLALWCEHKKIAIDLNSDNYLLNLTPINIINEINSLLVRLTQENSINNNNVFMSYDENVIPVVSTEKNLFSTMFYIICQHILAGQQDCFLTIVFKSKDVTNDQQNVHCRFSVSGKYDEQKLAHSLNELIEPVDIDGNIINGSIACLQRLFNVFNITKRQSDNTDEVTNFTFNLPLMIDQSMEKQTAKIEDKLKNKHVLVVSSEQYHRENIRLFLTNAKATVETMRDTILFTRQVNTLLLKSNPLDLVIISAEEYASSYSLVQRHIHNLPEKLQPKLLVIQPSLMRDNKSKRIFSQSYFPWFYQDLIENVANFLLSDKKSNILIDYTDQMLGPYLANNVDLLLATNDIKEHQVLLQVLFSLGFNVTVVNDQTALEQHWQTALYLVVISEYNDFNPRLTQDIHSQRGLFKLATHRNDRTQFLPDYSLTDGWKKAILPPVLDNKAMIDTLSPWLKPAIVTTDTNNTGHETNRDDSDNDKPIVITTTNTIVAKEKLTPTPPANIEHNNVINMTQFVANQGSIEFASLMLDDYLEDISQLLKDISCLISEDNITQAQQLLKRLSHLADVLSAKNLHQQSLLFINKLQSFIDDADNDKPANAMKEEWLMTVKELTKCYEELTEHLMVM